MQFVESKKVSLPENSFIWDPVQYMESKNEKYFVYFDKRRDMIYWIDYKSGEVIKEKTTKLTIKHEGLLRNFFVLSTDSIYVIDYNRICTLYLLDIQGSIKSAYNLGINKGSLIGTEQEPYIMGNDIFLSGYTLDETTSTPGTLFPCYVYNTPSNEYKPVTTVEYPSEYYRYHWGNGQMRSVYSSACYQHKHIMYSFPISHRIYVFDVINRKMKTYEAGSSLIEKITHYSDQKGYKPAEKVDCLKYFFEQPSYYNIIYDPYHSLYYRLTGLPSEKFNIKDMKTYKKKLSVIILDENFQFLGETMLDDMYHPQRAFVNDKGLHIVYQESISGDIITYHIFNPQKINR